MMDSVTMIPQLIGAAMAPVFLLAGIGGFLNVIAMRLGRAVDRWRALPEGDGANDAERVVIQRRVACANLAIALCVASGLSVCAVVVLLFVNPLTAVDIGRAAGWMFVVAMICLAGGLCAFLAEIRLASRVPLK